MIETELNSNIDGLPIFDDCLLHNRIKARHRRHRINRTRKKADLMRIIDYKKYSPHIGYVDCSFNGIKFVRTGRYIKFPKNSKCQKWMKKATSHKYRANKDIPRKGNYYRRLFDYWWTMY